MAMQKFTDGPATLLVNVETGKVNYRYRAINHDPHTTCEFDLLSEVGESYQQYFRDILAREGLVVETHETASDFYERVKPPVSVYEVLHLNGNLIAYLHATGYPHAHDQVLARWPEHSQNYRVQKTSFDPKVVKP